MGDIDYSIVTKQHFYFRTNLQIEKECFLVF